jgi:hypothetical protein
MPAAKGSERTPLGPIKCSVLHYPKLGFSPFILEKLSNKSASADLGPSLLGKRMLDSFALPLINTSGNSSLQGAKKMNNFPMNFLTISGDSRNFLFFPKFGAPKSYFLCDLKPHAIFPNR